MGGDLGSQQGVFTRWGWREIFKFVKSEYLPNCIDVAGHDSDFTAVDEPHGDALRFVVMAAVQEINTSDSSAKTKCGTGSLSCRAARYKRTHDRVGFTVAVVQAMLGGDGVDCNKTGKKAGADLIFTSPKGMLARSVG